MLLKPYIGLLLLTVFISFDCLKAQTLQYLNTSNKTELTQLPMILNYQNASGEKGYTFFEYDGNNLLRKGKWELEDKQRSSINYYRYNGKNQLETFYREFSDGLNGTIQFDYDAKGRVKKETFKRSDGITGTGNYFYAETGEIQRLDCENIKGWFTGVIVFSPNGNSPPERAEIYVKDKVVGSITYRYKDHLLVEEHWEFTNRWWQTFKWDYCPAKTLCTSSNVFIPENNRFRLIEEKYDYNKKQGGPSLFKYDGEGRLTEKVFVRSDQLKTTTTFTYSPKGLLKESIRHYNDGRVGKFVYTWNERRKIQTRSLIINGNLTGAETYTYDEEGKLTMAQWDHFDGWLTGVITFDYQQSDQIQKGHFNGSDDFDADLKFEYNENGNLSTINWRFSFGETQTYSFNYEDLYSTVKQGKNAS